MRKYFKYSRTTFGKNGLMCTTHYRRTGRRTYKSGTTCKYLPYHTPYNTNNTRYNKSFHNTISKWYKN